MSVSRTLPSSSNNKIHGGSISWVDRDRARRPKADQAQLINKADDSQDPYSRVHNYLAERRLTLCHVTSTVGQLVCLRDGCGARFDNTNAWLRHLRRIVPSRVWLCGFCPFVTYRGDQLVQHLQRQHPDVSIDRLRLHEAETAYAIQYNLVCGWCDFSTQDWLTFFQLHVYEHLTAKGGHSHLSTAGWNMTFPPPSTLVTPCKLSLSGDDTESPEYLGTEHQPGGAADDRVIVARPSTGEPFR